MTRDERAMADRYERVFTAQASRQDCNVVLFDLFYRSKLWGELKSPEDLTLHNFAKETLKVMGMRFVLPYPENRGQVSLEIIGELPVERPAHIPGDVQDVRREA